MRFWHWAFFVSRFSYLLTHLHNSSHIHLHIYLCCFALVPRPGFISLVQNAVFFSPNLLFQLVSLNVDLLLTAS